MKEESFLNLTLPNKFKQTEIGMIPDEWEVRELKELVSVKGRIGWKGLKKSEFGTEGVIIINGPDIKNGKVDWKGCQRVPKWRYEESQEISVKQYDIIMTKDGTIGKTAYIKYLPEQATLASGIFLIRTKSHMLNQNFLYQYFNSNFFKKLVASRIEGSVVPHLYQRDIELLLIPLPPLPEQRAIAKILSDLDAKIELNQQMNKTLEEIGRAIFKHWFIDFEFPNEEGKPYKSSGGEMEYNEELGKEIPKGWRVKSIDEVAYFLNGLALQKYPAENDEEYLPVIKIRELRQGITESSDKASVNIPKNYIVNDGDILFSWSGSLEVVIWAYGKGALNQHLFKVTSKNYPKWFYYYWILEYLPEYRHIAEGKATTVGHIQRHHLKNSLVLIPDKITLLKMDQMLSPLIEKIIRVRVESRNLSSIRDLLLPKLMSGKIRVPVSIGEEFNRRGK